MLIYEASSVVYRVISCVVLREIRQFDLSRLRKVTHKPYLNKLACSHLNWKLSEARLVVYNLKVNAKRRQKNIRFGVWSLDQIFRRIEHLNASSALYGHRKQLQRYLRREIGADLNQWHARKSIALSHDPRQSYLGRYQERRVFDCATFIQSCARGYLARTLPRIVDESVFVGNRRLESRFGLMNIRTLRRDGKWKQMVQYYVNIQARRLQLFSDEDAAMTVGRREDSILYFCEDLVELCIECKAKSDKMPGFTLNPVRVARADEGSFRTKVGTTVWIYSTAKPSTRQEVLRLFDVLTKLVAGMKVERSYSIGLEAKVASLSKRWKLGAEEEDKRQVNVKFLQEQAETAAQLRTVSVDTKKKVLRMQCDIFDIMQRLDSTELNLWESRIVRSYTMAKLTMASFDLYDIQNLKALRQRWHMAKYAAMVAFLKSHERHFDQVKDKVEAIYAAAVRKDVKGSRFRSAVVNVFEKTKASNIRRARFTASKRRYREAHDKAWLYRVQAYHVRLNMCARRIQTAYARYVAHEEVKRHASCVIQRFWRTCLARREFKNLLALKHAQDKKLWYASNRLAKRKLVASFLRWQEYVVLFQRWKHRIEAFRRSVCARKLQLSVRRHVFREKRRIIFMFRENGLLHNRVRQLVIEFLADPNFTRLLCQLDEDYRQRAAIPLRLEDSIQEQLRIVCAKSVSNRSNSKWPFKLSKSHPIALRSVLAPYMHFSCYKAPCLLLPFWKAMYAVQMDYRHYEQSKVQYDNAVVARLERQLLHKCVNFRAEAQYKDAILRWHGRSEVCSNCYALYTSKAIRRCTACLSPRYLWEKQQKTSITTTATLFLFHAAFFTRVQERTHQWQRQLTEADKLRTTAMDIRTALPEQTIWNEVVRESYSSARLIVSAGFNTVPKLVSARSSKQITRFQDWGFPPDTCATLDKWCKFLSS